jgi:hypothetical protein
MSEDADPAPPQSVEGIAAGVEELRARRAATLALEALLARQKAADVAAEVVRLTVEVGGLSVKVEQMSREVSEVHTGMTAVLASTEALHRGYGVDESALHDRARFPALLEWFGRLNGPAGDTGMTRLAALDEVLEQWADRRRTTTARRALLYVILPILGALLVAVVAWYLPRAFPVPAR